MMGPNRDSTERMSRSHDDFKYQKVGILVNCRLTSFVYERQIFFIFDHVQYVFNNLRLTDPSVPKRETLRRSRLPLPRYLMQTRYFVHYCMCYGNSNLMIKLLQLLYS
jgi:hypothetical protein